jgi:RNA polymerase sigma factor (sigma-70 family)
MSVMSVGVPTTVDGPGNLGELVAAAQAGDAAAFTTLVVRFQALAVGLAVGWVGDIERAREVAQEAFLEAHLHLRDLRDPDAFVPWFRRIVAKHCDRVTRRPALPLGAPLAGAGELGDPTPNPAEDLERRDEARAVRAALERLRPHERVVLALQYLGGYSQVEIARALGLPPTTVKKRAHDARRHLREELSMVRTSLTHQGSAALEAFSDELELFLAIRRGDTAAVTALLARRPELVRAREAWSADDAHRARLPYAREGTALIRAAERGELEIVKLLLDAGADVDGACGCRAGETPLWAAAAADYPQVVAYLLERGANPNARGPRGHTALHIAAMRGWPHLARALLEHGADPRQPDDAGRTPLDWAALKRHAEVADLLRDAPGGSGAPTGNGTGRRVPVEPAGNLCETGIKLLDLFVPLRHGDLVLVDGDVGMGLVVLLGELTMALRESGYRQALWTGFEQPLLNVRELDHALGESGRRQMAQLALVPQRLGGAEARDAFVRILDQWEQSETQAAGRRLLVVFEAAGQVAEVEATLPRLTRGGSHGTTAIVVAPEVFPPRGAGRQAPLPPGVAAHVRFDLPRARRGLYPAVSALASTSASLSAETVGAEHAAAAAAARRLLADYARIDPDLALPEPASLPPGQRTTAIRAQRLHAFLTQPFVFAEPFIGRPGVRVSRAATVQGVKLILEGAADAIPLHRLSYTGELREHVEGEP